MQTRRPLSLVTITTTQTHNNTNEFLKMETSNTRKTNENKNIKHKNQTTLLTNITQKNTRIAGKTTLFHRLKAKQETSQKPKHRTKTKKYQKQSQHRNRKAETYTMQTKTRATEEKNKLPKMKASWVSKREC